MLITARAAALRLADVDLSRRHADRVLAAGLAGSPLVTTTGHLYEEAAIDELRQRPWLTDRQLRASCPQGLFVARRAVESTDELQQGWGLSPITAIWITTRIRRDGFVPLVATVGGFVTHGAEITEVHVRDGATPVRPDATLVLREASASWYDLFRTGCVATGRGRPWVLIGFDLIGTTPEPWENHAP